MLLPAPIIENSTIVTGLSGISMSGVPNASINFYQIINGNKVLDMISSFWNFDQDGKSKIGYTNFVSGSSWCVTQVVNGVESPYSNTITFP